MTKEEVINIISNFTGTSFVRIEAALDVIEAAGVIKYSLKSKRTEDREFEVFKALCGSTITKEDGLFHLRGQKTLIAEAARELVAIFEKEEIDPVPRPSEGVTLKED